MSHRELGAAGEMGLPRLASSQAFHGGAGSRRTWLGSLAQGCEVTPGLVPSLSSSLLGEMSRPVSARHWLWEPPSAEGWGSDLCQPGAQWPVFLSSATRFCFNRPRCRENGRTGQCVDTCFWFRVTAMFLAPFASGPAPDS